MAAPMIIGLHVQVVIDRPLGSIHPEHPTIQYPVNYGYVPGIIGGDGERQDVYVFDMNEPIKQMTGFVIGIIHRRNDSEDKWIVTPKFRLITVDEIRRRTHFQEKYFDDEIWLLN